jgi:hypothetical protein
MYASGCSMLCQPWRPEGLFKEALAIPGIERWPFDLARVQLVYGERLRRAQVTTESRLPAGTRRPWRYAEMSLGWFTKI